MASRTGISRMRWLQAMLMGLVLILLLSACGQATSTGANDTGDQAQEQIQEQDRVVVDGMGHEVTVPANPERVLASYLEDHLVALGVTPVAQWSAHTTSKQDYLKDALANVPLIDSKLPPEQVASFQPDLIIVESAASVEKGLYEQYSAIAPTYVLSEEETADWRKAFLKVGELMNKKTEAEQRLEEYDRKLQEAKEQIHAVIGDESAVVLWLTEKNVYMVDPGRSSGTVLYQDLGITKPNLAQELESTGANWMPVSLEKLAELDANHIFLVNSEGAGTAEALKRSIWLSLPAVKEGHVYTMPKERSWLYSGIIANEGIVEDVLQSLGAGATN